MTTKYAVRGTVLADVGAIHTTLLPYRLVDDLDFYEQPWAVLGRCTVRFIFPGGGIRSKTLRAKNQCGIDGNHEHVIDFPGARWLDHARASVVYDLRFLLRERHGLDVEPEHVIEPDHVWPTADRADELVEF